MDYLRRKIIDKIFERLNKTKEPLTELKIKKIIIEHGRFLNQILPIIRKNRTPRSLVSKYMHFHCPSIPIYDSIGNRSLTQQFRWNDRYEVIEKPKIADEEF